MFMVVEHKKLPTVDSVKINSITKDTFKYKKQMLRVML